MFMTGFYYKDFILECAYGLLYINGWLVYFIATIDPIFTTLYCVKVLYLTYLTNHKGPIVNYRCPSLTILPKILSEFITTVLGGVYFIRAFFRLPKPVGFVSLPLKSEPTTVILTTITYVIVNATIATTAIALGWEPVGAFELWQFVPE